MHHVSPAEPSRTLKTAAGQLFQFGFALGVLLLISVLSPGSARAQIPADPPVRLAYTEFAPYSFTAPDGTAQGLAIDLARRLLAPSGRQLAPISVANPAAAIDMLNSGTAEMSGLLGQTDARAQIAAHTAPLGSLRTVLFAKKAAEGRTISDFSGQRIGVVSGSVGIKVVDAVPFAEVVELRNLDDLVMALMTERVDAVIAPANGCQARLRLMGSDPLVDVIEPPLQSFPFVFYVNKAQTDLLAALQREIALGLQPAELTALDEIWFGKPTRAIEQDIIFWGSLTLVALALGTMAAVRGSLFHARTVKQLSKETEESRLLIDALNAVDASIIIFDRNFRAVHWNTGFLRTFPTIVEHMENGGTYHALVSASYADGSMAETTTVAEANQRADALLEKLKSGQTARRMIKAIGGRVFEAADFRVGAHHYASVRVDMSRLFDQAELIKTQKAKLEVVNDKLQRFNMLAAHDLKAPLQQQVSLLRFVEEDLRDAHQQLPEDDENHLATVKTLNQRMTQLVGDLLENAQVDQSRQIPSLFNPINRLPAILQLAAIPKGFDVIIAPDMPDVTTVPAAFDTVLRNLISNAAKHHDQAQGVIRVQGHREARQIVIEVADDGPGIPTDYLARIFEPSQRLSTKKEGFGLCLSFIQDTVEGWGGEISVSCPPQGGSVFRFTVPLVPVSLMAVPQPEGGVNKPH